MIAPRAIAMLVASLALCVCAEAALAKVTRPRHPAASRPISAGGQVVRKTPPVVHGPARDEKNWMERASAPSTGGGGGGGGM